MQHRHAARQLIRVVRELAALLERAIEDAPDDSTDSNLPKIQKAIMEALASGEAVTAKKLARRTDYAYCSSFRACLTAMCRRGLLSRTPDGYKRVEKAGTGPVKECILGALADGVVLKSSELAERAGYPYNSRFRTVLADMGRAGVIVRTPDGYQLPSTPAPSLTVSPLRNGHH